VATRSFLLITDHEEGLHRLLNGTEFPKVGKARAAFSDWLEQRLIERLKAFGSLEDVKPILLGSWSRHELSPKSDIDLLFAGEESVVKEFVTKAFKDGLKLRARVPENPEDWSVGVEPFDVLALNSATAMFEKDEPLLLAQAAHARKQRRSILKAIKIEREERRKRQDSIANLLEPNLKFGAGGLRDIEQALALKALFPDKFSGADSYPFDVLAQIKDEFLFLRNLLHLLGSGDVMSAHDQLEIAKRLKLESAQGLMKFVQRELERASFYADWAMSNCASSPQKRLQAKKDLGDINAAVQALRKDPANILRQYEIRRLADDWEKNLPLTEAGKTLHKAIYNDQPDALLVALHRTRLLEVLIPDFKKLKGLVQHDHYHRFTADAHLVQTLREVQRAKSKSKIFGVISQLNKDLTPQDWWTLKLTALFHDLAKGRKGDHSTEGAKLVEKYFDQWDFSENLKQDVRWLVESHLLMSTASFRQNPQSPSTWKRLFARGVEGRRLVLLAMFTAIDIRATNPEAWTPWKAQLLLNLVNNMRSPEAQSLNQHLSLARKDKRAADIEEWLGQMDPLLLQMLPPRLLITDLKDAAKANQDLGVKVWKDKKGKLWARFHRKVDQPGLFLSFMRQLFGFGLSVQISSVHTINEVGVYDWFQLKTEKNPKQIAKWLDLPQAQEIALPKVQFQSIDVMSQDEEEWILSFKGRDQRGLLLNAAEALAKEKLSIRWARAHTWGNQVEDVFSVRPLGDVTGLLSRLNAQFVT
jgi:[protein-PII] uridylyltransferase